MPETAKQLRVSPGDGHFTITISANLLSSLSRTVREHRGNSAEITPTYVDGEDGLNIRVTSDEQVPGETGPTTLDFLMVGHGIVRLR